MSENEQADKKGKPGAAETAKLPDHSRGPSEEELRDGFRKMRRLEWMTLAYQVGAAVLIVSLAGGSQAMKTEWMENALAIVPAAGALITFDTENRSEQTKHPFGNHRVGTIAFMAAAFALAGIGAFLFYDNLSNLIKGERPSIGGFPLFGHTIWHGWLMMVVMALTAVPPILLAKAKIPVARLLHDKPLYADAEMNQANWLTNGAGVIGLGLVAGGFWWGDALAALLISLDVLHDGFTNVRRSLADVMDRCPVDLETDKPEAIVDDVRQAVRALPFVADSQILMREHGRYLFAEIFIRPHPTRMPADVTEATRQVREAVLPLDWRFQHVAVEFTHDVKAASDVLTREELQIEAK